MTSYKLSVTVAHLVRKQAVVFGYAGDVVNLIADNANVMIVENKKGERVPLHKDKLEIIN